MKQKKDIWYAVEYYLYVGQHGEIQSFDNFNDAYKEALKFKKREEKYITDGDYGYIGVNTNGDKFAVIYVDNNYISDTEEFHFESKENYDIWIETAKKCLETGEPQKGVYTK
jgi:hypothetical protein